MDWRKNSLRGRPRSLEHRSTGGAKPTSCERLWITCCPTASHPHCSFTVVRVPNITGNPCIDCSVNILRKETCQSTKKHVDSCHRVNLFHPSWNERCTLQLPKRHKFSTSILCYGPRHGLILFWDLCMASTSTCQKDLWLFFVFPAFLFDEIYLICLIYWFYFFVQLLVPIWICKKSRSNTFSFATF